MLKPLETLHRMLRFYEFCRQPVDMIKKFLGCYYINYIIALDFEKIRNKNIQKIGAYLQVIIFHICKFFIKKIINNVAV